MSLLFVTIFELVVVLILLRRFTGKEVLVPKASSGTIRLTVGLLCAFGAYLIMAHCIEINGQLCPDELRGGTFFACIVLAVLLIPLGAIQVMWFLTKRPPDRK
jgi:energy-converting hydrogenase Eha subunit B